MPVEAFAATLPQQGRTTNEDAFLIRGHSVESAAPPFVAIADGAGAAEAAAKRALRDFERLTLSAEAEHFAAFTHWVRWLRSIDAAMTAGPEATFAAVAVLEERLVGAAVGDSRVYVWRRDGDLQLLTEGVPKHRIGSGCVQPHPLHVPFERGDLLLLLTDGAWAPLSISRLRSIVARSILKPLADLPETILTESSRGGRGDDMTVVVARRR
jgi:serine/threonine protein phosphatase PrpC